MRSRTPDFIKRRNVIVVAALALMLCITAGVIKLQQSSSQPVIQPSSLQPGGEEAAKYAADPTLLKGESPELHSIEDYWLTRIGYPTGKFNSSWLLQASNQDKQVSEKVPAGLASYGRTDHSQSPLQLDPNSWTALGPQPEQSNGCTGCYSYGPTSGRINDIVIDPVNTNVAYLATVGGGVWKTTNCCTTATTFAPVTDNNPLIATSSVDDISIDPNNHNTIYVGTGDLNFGSFSMGSIGVLKSTDAGATWTVKGSDVFGLGPVYPEPAGNYPQYQAIGKVEADPNNSNIVVAGTKTGIYISYNGGDNWTGPCYTNAYNNTERQDTTALILSSGGSSTNMYVAVGSRGYSTTVQSNLAENGANGIYKTTVPASGCPANWTLTSRADNGWPVGTGSGVPQYQANGDQLGRIDMAIAPSDPNTLYAIVQAINPTANRGSVLGVWRTADGGATWTEPALNGSSATDWTGCDRTGAQSWYNQRILVDPNDPNTVYADTIDIFKSTNGADTFTNLTCGYSGGTSVHTDQHSLAYAGNSSSVMLTGSDGGAYVTTNANATTPTFTQINSSLNTIEFYSGDITANFATSASPGINAGAQDNGSSVKVYSSGTPGPTQWQERKGGDGMYARIEPVMGLRWYQESQNGALAVSVTGATGPQTSATGGWTADSPRLSFVFPYEIYKGTPNNPATDCQAIAPGCTHMIGGSYRVWETIAGGIPSSSWYANSPDLTKNTLADRSFINQLSYAVSISTTAIVGTNDGNVQYGFNMGQGTANTATWVNVTGGNAVLPNRPIQDVTTDPVNALIGYAAIGGFDQNTPSTPGHLYMVTCTANCATFTWVNKSGNLPNIPVNTVMANPNYPQQVFLGTDWGFYYTDDITQGAPVWHHFNSGIPNVMIWDLAIDRGSTTLAAFTRGRGAYVWPLPNGPVTTPTPGGTSSPTVTVLATGTSTSTSVATSTGTVASATSTNTGVPSSTGTSVSATSTAVSSATSTTMATAQATNTGMPQGTETATTATTPDTATATTTATAVATATTTTCNIRFEDVPSSGSGSTFYSFITCLACRGIIGGYPCGSVGEPCNGTQDPYFRPNASVTRGQISKMVALSANLTGNTGSQIFEDVAPGSTFYDPIQQLASRGYISGYACGGPGEPCGAGNRPYFRPSANTSRGQLTKIVSNTFGFNDDPGTQRFTDVPASSPFFVWIQRLSMHSVIDGYTCGGPGEPCNSANMPYFRPGANVSRGQTAKIVSNTFFPGCTQPADK